MNFVQYHQFQAFVISLPFINLRVQLLVLVLKERQQCAALTNWFFPNDILKPPPEKPVFIPIFFLETHQGPKHQHFERTSWKLWTVLRFLNADCDCVLRVYIVEICFRISGCCLTQCFWIENWRQYPQRRWLSCCCKRHCPSIRQGVRWLPVSGLENSSGHPHDFWHWCCSRAQHIWWGYHLPPQHRPRLHKVNFIHNRNVTSPGCMAPPLFQQLVFLNYF